jgi:SpoIID/LytB domain protein
LAPDGDGLALGGKPFTPSGHVGRWHRLRTGLPATAEFYSSQHFLRVLFQDGTSGRYHGRIGATRSGSGELTVNNVGLDGYTKGVVSKEISPSWPHAAVAAQAIAARTYGLFEKVFYPGPHYDICDTTWCQVYGGISHLDASGNIIWRADPTVVRDNRNEVLIYNGDPIFAQYSASNGGATVDGGHPYLVGESDPYDSSRWTPDPYLDESRSVSESGFAAAFGLQRITSITVTQRDGHGPWGGRIVSATVSGVTAGGAVKSVSASGSRLGDIAGVGTDYLRFGA